MVRMDELVATILIGDFRMNQAMRADIMRAADGLRKSHAKILRYSLPFDWSNVQVAVQSTFTPVISLDDDPDVRLFGLSHCRKCSDLRMRLCFRCSIFCCNGILLTHVSATLCCSVTSSPRKVINLGRQIDPYDGVCRTTCLR